MLRSLCFIEHSWGTQMLVLNITKRCLHVARGLFVAALPYEEYCSHSTLLRGLLCY